MADDKTTNMPEQPVTDTGPGKETPPEQEKTPTPPEAEKKTEQQAKSPQVSVYDFAEIMKGKKAEERAAASGGEKPAPAKTEKPEKQPEAPKKAEGSALSKRFPTYRHGYRADGFSRSGSAASAHAATASLGAWLRSTSSQLHTSAVSIFPAVHSAIASPPLDPNNVITQSIGQFHRFAVAQATTLLTGQIGNAAAPSVLVCQIIHYLTHGHTRPDDVGLDLVSIHFRLFLLQFTFPPFFFVRDMV
jgi:hypothetical protein